LLQFHKKYVYNYGVIAATLFVKTLDITRVIQRHFNFQIVIHSNMDFYV